MASFLLVSVFVIYGSYPIIRIPAFIPQPFCEKTDVEHIFPPEKIRFSSFNHTVSRSPKRVEGEPWCEQWAVLSTVFEPSEAVHRQVRMKDWCLVVVGDRKSPKKYETNWTPGEGSDAVVYLSPEDQESMHNIFVNSLPWNHFGRKNVGYLYAMCMVLLLSGILMMNTYLSFG